MNNTTKELLTIWGDDADKRVAGDQEDTSTWKTFSIPNKQFVRIQYNKIGNISKVKFPTPNSKNKILIINKRKEICKEREDRDSNALLVTLFASFVSFALVMPTVIGQTVPVVIAVGTTAIALPALFYKLFVEKPKIKFTSKKINLNTDKKPNYIEKTQSGGLVRNEEVLNELEAMYVDGTDKNKSKRGVRIKGEKNSNPKRFKPS